VCQVSSAITTQKLEKEGIWNSVDDLIARVHPILGIIRKTLQPLYFPSLHFLLPLNKKKKKKKGKINVPHVGTTQRFPVPSTSFHLTTNRSCQILYRIGGLSQGSFVIGIGVLAVRLTIMILGWSCYEVQRLTSDYVPTTLAASGRYQSIGGGLHEKQPIVLFS
jgi:hypothetical protein